jgi:plasmid maintenance system antidote protein VapI
VLDSHAAIGFYQFWLGLQDDFDIEAELDEKRDELDHIKPFAVA